MRKTDIVKRPAHRAASVLNAVVCILFGVLILCVVAVGVFVLLFSKNGQPFFLADKTVLWILTDSMADEIPENTFILAQKVDPDEIEPGDVITFISDDPDLNGARNTHRVLKISEDRSLFYTKGDHNAVADRYPARAENVLCRYESKIDWLTTVGRLFVNKTGPIIYFAAVMILLDLFLFPLFYGLIRSKKEKLAREKQSALEDAVKAEVERLQREAAQSAQTDGDQQLNASASTDSPAGKEPLQSAPETVPDPGENA